MGSEMKTTDETITLSRFDFEDTLIYAERFEIFFAKKPSEIYPIINKYMTQLSLNAVDVIMRDINQRLQYCEEWNIDINDCWKKLYTDLYFLGDSNELIDMFILSYEEFKAIIINAMRYAIGRMTYAPHTVCGIVNEHIKYLSNNTLEVIKQDIEEHMENNNLGNPSIDAPAWKKTYNNIKEELSRRMIK